jgi:predicted site-specific integrase-resolvase
MGRRGMQSDIGHDYLRAAPAGLAARVLGISTSTLRLLWVAGKIQASRTPGGQRRYDVAAYLESTKSRATS